MLRKTFIAVGSAFAAAALCCLVMCLIYALYRYHGYDDWVVGVATFFTLDFLITETKRFYDFFTKGGGYD